MKNRILSMILALSMVLTLLPGTAFAMDEKEVKNLTELQTLITNATGDLSIRLLDEERLHNYKAWIGTLTIPTSNAYNITIDLGEEILDGKTATTVAHKGSGKLSIKSSKGGEVISESDNYGTIVVDGGGSLEIKDVSIQNTGDCHAVYNKTAGDITVLGGLVVTKGMGNAAVCNEAEGSVNLLGGELRTAESGNTIQNDANGSVNVSGGTVSAILGAAIFNKANGSVTISGGTVKNRDITNGYAIFNYGTGKVTVSGGMISAYGACISNRNDGNLSISGGTVEGNGDAIGVMGKCTIPNGTVVIKSSLWAMEKAPNVSEYTDVKIIASRNLDGTEAEDYNPLKILSYKYLKFEPITIGVPTATTNVASSLSQSTVTLNGTISAHNDLTEVLFEYGTSTSYGSTVVASPSSITGEKPTSVSAVLTELKPNTTYHYRVKASNSKGEAYGADQSFTTMAILPTVTANHISVSGATGLRGVFKKGDTVTVTWDNTVGGDNNSDTIRSVRVDFSQFGGNSAVEATNSNNIWTATYTIQPKNISGTNKNVSITATNDEGISKTTVGTTNATVDDKSPNVIFVKGPENGTYKIGANLDFTCKFTEDMTLNTDNGKPYMYLKIGAQLKKATYLRMSGARDIVFRYTVSSGDYDADGIECISPFNLDGSTLQDSAGNPSELTFILPLTYRVFIDAFAPKAISIDNPSITEGNFGTTELKFTVTLSDISSKAVTVDYATENGTAVSGTDYMADRGKLVFNPGETSKTISILVNGDTDIESDETLYLNLTNPVNVTIEKSSGEGTILNDDVSIERFELNYIAGENGTITGETVQTVNRGSSASTVTAVANEGYHFVSWSDGIRDASRTDSDVEGNITVTATFELDVPIGYPLSIATTTPSAGKVGIVYSGYSFTATGGVGEKHYEITAGDLPEGLVLEETGALVGIPTKAGTYTFSVTVTDSATVQNTDTHEYTVRINESDIPPKPTENKSNSNSGSDYNDIKKEEYAGNASVTINGENFAVGKEEKLDLGNGKTETKVIIEKEAVLKQIEAKSNTGENNTIEIRGNTGENGALRIGLTGDIIKSMEDKRFDLSIKKDNVDYRIPSKEMTIDKIAEKLGLSGSELQKIEVEVIVSPVSDELKKSIEEVSKRLNNTQFIVPPMNFEIKAKATSIDGKTIETNISTFNQYVARVIEIPNGVDPRKITTGIVFNEDGTFQHVPTVVYQEKGKWYARINSRSNSSYSVVYNPIEVDAVKNHWAKESVNNMASRMVITEIEGFNPNEAITRGEFADYITRGLGIYKANEQTNSKFSDVSGTKFEKSIIIAHKYGIISGYENNTFKPESKITREEAMSMFTRAMEITELAKKEQQSLVKFEDAKKVSPWALDSVKTAISSKIFNGRSAKKIEPKGIFTKAEAATAIQNLLIESKLMGI